MTDKKIIELIDDYLTEPHNISKEWVEALVVCRQALINQEKQAEEIERLKRLIEELGILLDEKCERCTAEGYR